MNILRNNHWHLKTLSLVFSLSLFMYMGLFGSLPAQAKTTEQTLLILGDSLSTGYGLALSDSWPYKIQQQWTKEQPHWQLMNASVSGETSQGALNRLPQLIQQYQPNWVFIEIGGNDGLRGLSLSSLEQNIAAMIRLVKEAGAQVLLAEIEIPMNLGPKYRQAFNAIYHRLAKENTEITLVPFFLSEIALNPQLMQADGIHPNAQAQPKIQALLEPYFNQALTRSAQPQPYLKEAM